VQLVPTGAVEHERVANTSPDDAFVVASSYGVRLEWDPFVQAQHLINTDRPGRGVQTYTRSRHGLTMVSEYLTYNRPTHMGMKMVTGPWFFRTFSGSWHFRALDDGRCEVTYRYRFECRPKLLRPISHRLGNWLLGRDIEARVDAFVKGAEDADIVARARAELDARA